MRASSEPTIATCDRCGATTDMTETFFEERRSFRTSIRTLCPTCWKKHKTSGYSWILINKLTLGLLGIILLLLLPNEGIGWVFLNIFVFEIALILSILPHELGHAFVAKHVGWRVFKIFIGFGKTVFKTTLFGFETEFRAVPLGGVVLAAPRDINHYRAKCFAFAFAGPLTNIILGVVLFTAMHGSLEGFESIGRHLVPFQMFFAANFLIVVENLLPRLINTTLGKTPSDGKQLLEALKADPNRAAQSHAAGFAMETAVCQEKKQFDEAESWLEKGLTLYPDNVQLLLSQGLNLLLLQRFNSAREYFLKALPLTDNKRILRSLVLNDIAYTNALIGGSDLLMEADRYSMEALTSLSWMPSIKGTRGTVLVELGKLDEAMPLLREAMQTHDVPSNKAENACWLAIAETRLGNLNAGRKYLDEARKFDSACFLIERAQNVLDGTKTSS
jgi:predicted negative regulator of RcsB-dependent stress response